MSLGAESRSLVYIAGIAGVILVLLAVLMILGVVPTSPLIVGVMFLIVACGFAGPYVIRPA
jgi:NhaP-type Na+/H+ and K+/H+ antiporter